VAAGTKGWTFVPPWPGDNRLPGDDPRHEKYSRNGVVGKDRCSNAHECWVHHHYNGSGPGAFGGSDEWPHVTLEISLPEGREDLAKILAKDLMDLADARLKEWKL